MRSRRSRPGRRKIAVNRLNDEVCADITLQTVSTLESRSVFLLRWRLGAAVHDLIVFHGGGS